MNEVEADDLQGRVDEFLKPFRERWALNMKETGHPHHHLTRSGKMVDDDPKAHPLHEDYLWEAGINIGRPKPWKHPRHAERYMGNWYETKAGKTWLKKHPITQVIVTEVAQLSLFA